MVLGTREVLLMELPVHSNPPPLHPRDNIRSTFHEDNHLHMKPIQVLHQSLSDAEILLNANESSNNLGALHFLKCRLQSSVAPIVLSSVSRTC
jgi:hypothetical protein